MVRLHKMALSLCVLLFTSLSVPTLAHASGDTPATSTLKERKSRNSGKEKKPLTANNANTTTKTASSRSGKGSQPKSAEKQKKRTISNKTTPTKTANSPTTKKTTAAKSVTRTAANKLSRQSASNPSQCVPFKGDKKACTKPLKSPVKPIVTVQTTCTARKGNKKACPPFVEKQPLALTNSHKARIQKAQNTAMTKLMGQIGKPYRWGGTSPQTGFDCSGLIYYAYKDLVKFRIPRTANEMYHLNDARPVNRSELQNGDLVFFRTNGRGVADHVGVYVGNGKFIQSPRAGRDIQITSLSEDYWVRHYVGARRVMTPKNLR